MKIKSPQIFEGCYARHLGNCTHKSREHFISRSILEIIGPFRIGGLPWIKSGESTKASINSLAASVLCGRHNSLLSAFDLEAAKFFGHMKLIDSKVTPHQLSDVPEVISFNGISIEKWLLKTLCGILASGNFLIDGESHGKLFPSNYLVDLLFSDTPWIDGIGLYIDYSGIEKIRGCSR